MADDAQMIRLRDELTKILARLHSMESSLDVVPSDDLSKMLERQAAIETEIIAISIDSADRT